jgi:hypothetical protein
MDDPDLLLMNNMHYLALIGEFLRLKYTYLDSFAMCLVSQKPKKTFKKNWGASAWHPWGSLA